MAAETITWFDPTGTSHVLDGSSSSNPLALQGRQGVFMPPLNLIDQRTPLRPGTTVRYVDVKPRIITLPVLISGNGNEITLRAQIRSMTEWFNTPAGSPGKLRSTAPDGSQRDLPAYYLGGLEGNESSGNRMPGSLVAPLQFEADKPFWQDTATTVTNYTNTQLGAGQTVTNASDYAAWPVWVFQGPMTNLVVTNTTTGQAIKMTANGGLALASGHTLTINTLAGTVIQDASTNVIGNLTTDSVLFALGTGANALTFTYTAGVNGTTTGQVTYTNQWFSA